MPFVWCLRVACLVVCVLLVWCLFNVCLLFVLRVAGACLMFAWHKCCACLALVGRVFVAYIVFDRCLVWRFFALV